MWILAHAGFASALFAASSGLWGKGQSEEDRARAFRWFLLGALLPDLVDKPLGRAIFGDYFQNGRIFFHTLLVLCLMLAVGLLLRRRGDVRILSLAAGMAIHLFLDAIWIFPETALWPFLGPFLRFPETGSFWSRLLEQLSNPFTVVTELFGLLALAISLWAMGYRTPKKVFGLLCPAGRFYRR